MPKFKGILANLDQKPLLPGGFLSRKLGLTVFAMGLTCVGGYFAAVYPAFVPSYPVFVGAITGLTALYMGGNVTNKMVTKPAEATSPTLPGAP